MPKQLRFLIVDDTEDMRAVMTRMVERAGHLADQAVDGVDATVALSDHHYDVMLLDLSMPRMSGEDVMRWLRDHPDRAHGLRVIVVSAWAAEQRGTLQELGVSEVLTKPFRMRQLTDLVAETSAQLAHADRKPEQQP
jgi:CheY-like chemotaxis protein